MTNWHTHLVDWQIPGIESGSPESTFRIQRQGDDVPTKSDYHRTQPTPSDSEEHDPVAAQEKSAPNPDDNAVEPEVVTESYAREINERGQNLGVEIDTGEHR